MTPEIINLFNKGDSLRMVGNYTKAVKTYQQIESLIESHDLSSQSALLNAKMALYATMREQYVPLLQSVKAQLSLVKPDSLLYRDVYAYLALSDFNGIFGRDDMADKYLDKAFSLLEECKKSNPSSSRWNNMSFGLHAARIQLLIFRDSLKEAEHWIHKAQKYAYSGLTQQVLRAFEADRLVRAGNTLQAAQIYDSLLRNGCLSFDHQASIGVNYVQLLINKGRINDAKRVLESMEPYTHQLYPKKLFLQLESIVAEKEGNDKKALALMRQSMEISDSLKQEWCEAATLIEADQIELAIANREVELKRKDNLRKSLLIAGLSVCLIGVGILIVIVVKRIHYVNTQKNVAEKKLGHRIGELTRLASLLNESINSAPACTKAEPLTNDPSLILRADINRESNGSLPDYDLTTGDLLSRLNILYPSLSKTELRMAVMILSGLSNKAIAEVSNRSLSTVKYTKYQLRKKLAINMPTEEYLRMISSMSDEDFARMAHAKSSF